MNRSTRTLIYPYGYSNSALSLCDALGARLIRREGSKYQYREGDTVINWGAYGRPAVLANVPVVNPFEAVRIASSKLSTFRRLNEANVPTLEWTQDGNVAQGWLGSTKVVARDVDRGSQGEGTHVYKVEERLENPHVFYTRYFRKQREFRIHVVRGLVIFEQEKLRKKDTDDVDKYIRSHGRGWCFAFKHLGTNPIPKECKDVAIAAVRSLGLDFGAVDLGYHSRNGIAVFEVNTAPGIEETSLKTYVEAFK